MITTVQSKNKSHQSGMTLVELMVALAISLILIAGVIQLFVSSKQTYRVTENASLVQESGRFAMYFLTQDIRMGDYWGCRGSQITIDNNLNADANFDTFSNAVTGVDNDATVNNIINGTDSITIKSTAGNNAYLLDIPASTSADLKVTDDSLLQKFDIVLLSDCIDGDIFQITNDPSVGGAIGRDNIVHNTGLGTPGNSEKELRKVYGANAQIFKLNFSTYSIQNGANGKPSLFRSVNGVAAQELVENIENMQILYGEDTDSDGSPNYYKPAGSAGLNMLNVVAVRISIVAVSVDDNVSAQASTYKIFDSNITPTDKRIRRVFTSTIVVRNRLS